MCPKLEFKSGDDAWYDVSVEMRGSQLNVHYDGFPDEDDELLRRGDFEGIKDLRSRFRFSSTQLQDEHCGEVKEGMAVCASCSTDGHDTKFFDAILQKVSKAKHQFIDGEEQCTCTFKVMWQAGSNAYKTTFVSCENICLLTPGCIESHPAIKAFIKLAVEKVSCKVRYVGRNPLKRKATNMKESNTTYYKVNQVEQGDTRSNGVIARDFENNYIASEYERVGDISNTCKRDVTIDKLKNKIESMLPSVNEVVDNTHHLASVSSHSRKREKTSIDGSNATNNVVIGSKVLLQQVGSSWNELENIALCNSYMDIQTRIYGYPHSENDIEVTKNTDDTLLSAKNHDKGKETHLRSMRKKGKFGLDLNSMPIELELGDPIIPTHRASFVNNILSKGLSQSSHSHIAPLPSNLSNANIEGNNIVMKDNNNDRIIEIQRPCGGWLEEEDGDISQNESNGFNVNNDNFGKFDCMNSHVKNKGSKFHEDHSLSTCGEMKKCLSNLVRDDWDGGYQCESIGEELSMEENQKANEITKDARNVFLASCWGKHKRQNYARRVKV